MIAPKDESSDLVMQWIRTEGLGEYATISPRLDAVVVEASISQIEKLLNADYTPFGWFPPSIIAVNITNSIVK
jgi:tripeptidyl-peptidase I